MDIDTLPTVRYSHYQSQHDNLFIGKYYSDRDFYDCVYYSSIDGLFYKKLQRSSFFLLIGNDTLLNENFVLNINAGPTTTGFSITVTQGFETTIESVSIHYLAVDRAFPYHLNVFNSIEANYSAGVLSNITTSTGIRTYINTINYTLLASSKGFIFTTFGSTLSSNGIALFTNTLYCKSTALTHPVEFYFDPTIISTGQFKINVIFPFKQGEC
jgi:hypothetical protein